MTNTDWTASLTQSLTQSQMKERAIDMNMSRKHSTDQLQTTTQKF